MENIEEQRDILGLPPYVFPAAMLVFGYPTEQQVLRKKPERADMKYIVHGNSYHALSAEELKDMLSYHSGGAGSDNTLTTFCTSMTRKLPSYPLTRTLTIPMWGTSSIS